MAAAESNFVLIKRGGRLKIFIFLMNAEGIQKQNGRSSWIDPCKWKKKFREEKLSALCISREFLKEKKIL